MYFRCEIGTGSGEIKNAATAEYKAYSDTISENTFVEFTQKITNEKTIELQEIPITIEYNSDVPSGTYYGNMGLGVVAAIQLDDNTYVLAISQTIYYAQYGEYRPFIYFMKVSVKDDGTATITKGSSIQLGNLSEEFIYYNNELYFVSCVCSNLTNSQNVSGSMYEIVAKVNTTTLTPTQVAKRTMISGTLPNTYMNVSRWFDKETGLIFSCGSIQDSNGGGVTFEGYTSLTASSYTYKKQGTDLMTLAQPAYTKGNTILLRQQYSGSTFVEGWYNYSSSGYTFVSSFTPRTSLQYNHDDKTHIPYQYSGYTRTQGSDISNYIGFDIKINNETDTSNKYEMDEAYVGAEDCSNLLYPYNLSYVERSDGKYLRLSYIKYESITNGSKQTAYHYFYKLNETGKSKLLNSQMLTNTINFTDTSREKDLQLNVGMHSITSVDNKFFNGSLSYIEAVSQPIRITHAKITAAKEDRIKPAETKIDGVTKTKATSTTAGQVYVLNNQ